MPTKPWTKKKRNLFALILGIILILLGMSGTSISLVNVGLKGIIIAPLFLLVIGIITAYMGAEEKW